MSRWGLTHKAVEILTPEEWNAVVDALNELDNRTPIERKGGVASFTGDGTTTQFNIAHGLAATPTVAFVGKKTKGIPDIDAWDVDATNITITFKTAPAAGVSFELWWLALRL